MQFECQFTKPWYSYIDDVAPLNATPASYVIGEAPNTLTIKYGTDVQGNGSSLVIAVAEAKSTPLAVDYTDKVLTITLATDATVSPITPDDTKNTYALIAAAINDIDGFTATAVGTGVIDTVAEADDFTDGHEGTVCVLPGTIIEKSATEWYICTAPNSKHDANWRKLTVATY